MAAVVGALIALRGGGSRIVVADEGRPQGIGSGDAGGPSGGNRRQDLHHQCDQHDRKKFLQPPAHHEPTRLPNI